ARRAAAHRRTARRAPPKARRHIRDRSRSRRRAPARPRALPARRERRNLESAQLRTNRCLLARRALRRDGRSSPSQDRTRRRRDPPHHRFHRGQSMSEDLDAKAEALLVQMTRARRRAKPRVAEALYDAEDREVSTPFGTVQAWRLGDGPAVLLVHGWEDDNA